jgi:hypothetical protein
MAMNPVEGMWLIRRRDEEWPKATELDIFLALGDYLLYEKEYKDAYEKKQGDEEVEHFATKGRPALLACWSNKGSAWKRMTEGLDISPLGVLGGDIACGSWHTPAEVCLAILERCGRLKLDFIRKAGLVGAPAIVIALFAILGAHHIVRGRKMRLSSLENLYKTLCKSPSEWSALRDTVGEATHRDKSPIGCERRPMAPPPFWKYYLTATGLEALGFWQPGRGTPGGDPWSQDTDRSGRGPQGNGADDDREIFTNIVSLESPKLDLRHLAVPRSLTDDLRFVSRFIGRSKGSWPVLLFHGPPGTGKTHAARCLAGASRQRLATATHARLQNKWHGDTEKAYTMAFEEAAEANAILLLDEADSMLYSREFTRMGWELSHANTLLKLLEDPPCPVILCTNLMPQLDAAIHRRVHHMLEFPMPSEDERRRIWALELRLKKLYPSRSIDLGALAKLPLTGGLIHNAAVQASQRKAASPRTYTVDTGSLLGLAEKELPKLGPAAETHRVVGFAR